MAWAMLLTVVLMGPWALWKIGISQLPDVDLPFLTVQVSWEGASPEAVEHDLLDPLEDALSQVEGVTAMTSTARHGMAQVRLEFEVRRHLDVAMQDVQAKVSQAQLL